MERNAEVIRKTRETDITVRLSLDGRGKAVVETGIGFFNHMLETLILHSFIYAEIKAVGDLEVDDLHLDLIRGENKHHAVEALFKAFARALKQAVQVRSSDKILPSTKGVL